MYRSTWKISNLVLVLTLALAGGVEAQQQHEQHHPGGMLLSHEQATGEPQETPAQAPMMQPPQGMMQQMQGMMGRGEMMMDPSGM